MRCESQWFFVETDSTSRHMYERFTICFSLHFTERAGNKEAGRRAVEGCSRLEKKSPCKETRAFSYV